MHKVKLIVNGITHELLVYSHEMLVDVLRERLDLIGTKKGCGAGECGSCTILMNGRPVNSCLVLAVQADGKEILTIEGLADGNKLHPIQKSFVENGGVQCGFCTPGVIMTAKELMESNPNPTEEEIRDGLIGHICRCTGYVKIVKSVSEAAKEMQSREVNKND